jgi:hypothetical protein
VGGVPVAGGHPAKAKRMSIRQQKLKVFLMLIGFSF